MQVPAEAVGLVLSNVGYETISRAGSATVVYIKGSDMVILPRTGNVVVSDCEKKAVHIFK